MERTERSARRSPRGAAGGGARAARGGEARAARGGEPGGAERPPSARRGVGGGEGGARGAARPVDEGGTRRTGGVRTSGRAARVVADVLRATSEELSRVGYAALRIEDVARRSEVNKTTIYRRWPTKAELVAAALQSLSIQPEVTDTGTLRGDLLSYLRRYAAFAASSLGRGISRMLLAERTHPELDPIARALRERYRRSRAAIVERGVARGELPAGTSAGLVAELVFAPVYVRLVTHSGRADDAFLCSVIDVVLAGARAGAARVEG